MRKIYTTLFILFFAAITFGQSKYEISFGVSPAFPIGDLKEYVDGGLGFNILGQTPIRDNLKVGVEIHHHKLKFDGLYGYSFNTQLALSGFANYYFSGKSAFSENPLKPFIGLGLGLYKSQYYDDGYDPANTGVVLSPRLGLRYDLEKVYFSSEVRVHASSGYADTYVPFLFNLGLKL